jgi:hypothetical protein
MTLRGGFLCNMRLSRGARAFVGPRPMLGNNLIGVGVRAMASIRTTKSTVPTIAAGAALAGLLALACASIAFWAMWMMI